MKYVSLVMQLYDDKLGVSFVFGTSLHHLLWSLRNFGCSFLTAFLTIFKIFYFSSTSQKVAFRAQPWRLSRDLVRICMTCIGLRGEYLSVEAWGRGRGLRIKNGRLFYARLDSMTRRDREQENNGRMYCRLYYI